MRSGHRKHPPGLQRLPRHHPENAPAAVRALVISLRLAGTLVLFTNVSPNSHTREAKTADKEYYWRLEHHPLVFSCLILIRDSGRSVGWKTERVTGFFPTFLFGLPLFLPFHEASGYLLFFFFFNSNKKWYRCVYYLAPARLWRSHHLVTSRSPSLAPRTLIFWPIGLSAALSVSEHWRSPTDRGRDGVGGLGVCRTLGKRSEVMHFSIRFWLTFFFTKMDTQCSITSWISVPLKAADRSEDGGSDHAPFHWKEAGRLKRGGGAPEHCWSWFENVMAKRNAPFLILVS